MRVCERTPAKKPSDAEGGIWFWSAISEQTVCEADKEHRRCGFAREPLRRNQATPKAAFGFRALLASKRSAKKPSDAEGARVHGRYL